MARDLRLFFLFRLLSTSYLFVPIRALFPLARGLTLFEVFLLSSIYSLTVIVTEVPTGALADRIGRRRSMMAGALAMVAACATFYVADSFALFAVAEALSALSLTMCSGADSAYLFDLLNEHGRGHEYARREGTSSVWHLVGQAVAFAAGGLLGAQNLALPYLVTAGVASLAFVAAWWMKQDRPHPSGELPTAREIAADMGKAWLAVARRPKLRWTIGYSAVVFVLLMGTIYIFQPYLKEAGYSITATGLIFAGMYLVGAFVAHHADWLRQRASDAALAWALLAVLVVTLLALGAVSAGSWVLAVMALQAAANGLYSPLVKPLLNAEIEDSQQRATILSVESMVRRAAVLVASPAIGWVMQTWSPAAGLTLCGLLGATAGIFLLRGDGLGRRAAKAKRAKAERPLTGPLGHPEPALQPEISNDFAEKLKR